DDARRAWLLRRGPRDRLYSVDWRLLEPSHAHRPGAVRITAPPAGPPAAGPPNGTAPGAPCGLRAPGRAARAVVTGMTTVSPSSSPEVTSVTWSLASPSSTFRDAVSPLGDNTCTNRSLPWRVIARFGTVSTSLRSAYTTSAVAVMPGRTPRLFCSSIETV